MTRKFLLLILLMICLRLPAKPAGADTAVVQIDLDDVIHPVSADYVRQGIAHAKDIGARAVILRINTPGGLLESMREIVGAVLDSEIPVITWVGPNGARAASAGFFVLLAGDVAAMAPGTNAGAAHPVTGSGEKIQEVMEKKVVSDITAYMRSFVNKRGRNAAAAELGIVESKSFSAQEALDQKLIDGIAADVPELLRKFNGKDIQRFNGGTAKLNLEGANVESYAMSTRQQLLSRTMDPNIAFILGLIGLVCIYLEVTHPGMILPGVAGAICLLLSLFAFNLLPVNWAGAALIVLAIVLFTLEATITSHGILGLGGIISMIAGAMMLVEGPIPELRIRLGTTIAVTLPVAVILIFLIRLAVKSRRLKTITGGEGMIGEVGIAKSDVFAEGKVFVHGEYWNASSESAIPEGAPIRVVKMQGLKLQVEEEKRN
jgi:membrane-bound serine protease (ClpP class)